MYICIYIIHNIVIIYINIYKWIHMYMNMKPAWVPVKFKTIYIFMYINV